MRRSWIGSHVAHESRDRTDSSASYGHQVYLEIVGLVNNRLHDAKRVMTGKMDKLKKDADRLEDRLKEVKNFSAKTVPAGTWCARVCFEDVPDLKECLKLVDSVNGFEAAAKKFLVVTNPSALGPKDVHRKVEDGIVKELSYSSSAAIHRAMGIIPNLLGTDVTAYPLAGNVYIVTQGELGKSKTTFGIGNGGKYKNTIAALTERECQQALKAVRKIADLMESRNAKNGLFGYSGVYQEAEKIKDKLYKVDRDEIAEVKRSYKNVIKLEDAVTTALDRVGEGLLDWVKATIKANE
ncbi:hypothetical protein ACFXH4_000197 [Shigella flexneri]|nr:hypothetical protein [Salmonella enterica subsp. enterica serovar Braenderup]EGH2802841.1 hypothetical protein [Salmonella enterica]HCS5018701.1 hypothetical protein [Escherichia coli]